MCQVRSDLRTWARTAAKRLRQLVLGQLDLGWPHGKRAAVPTYRVNNLALWLDEPESLLGRKAAEKLGVKPADLVNVRVVRSVLDARKKNSPRYIHTVEVEFAPGKLPKIMPPDVSEADPPPPPALPVKRQPEQRPIIAGARWFSAVKTWRS
jgi:hypothetical protein